MSMANCLIKKMLELNELENCVLEYFLWLTILKGVLAVFLFPASYPIDPFTIP